jgi:DNA-binding PadR family transcriptional regulator
VTDPDLQHLPNSAVHILIAIGPHELHGYAIMAQIDRITDGLVRIGPGTLYTSIKRLMDAGLLEESGERPDPSKDDERRRYYRLTPAGMDAARVELSRLKSLVAAADAWAAPERGT